MRHLKLALGWVMVIGAVAAGVMVALLAREKRSLAIQLNHAEHQIGVLDASLTASQAEEDVLQQRIREMDTGCAATKRELTDLHIELEQRDRTLADTEHQLTESQAAYLDLQAQAAGLNEELTRTREELRRALPSAQAAHYREVIASLEDQIFALENRLSETPNPLVAGRGDHAQVVQVGPQNAFVVINFGERHGARPNQRLTISRGPERLAMVEISDSRENYSIAQVLAESLSGKLRIGDAASLTP
ncbi:hypothetical protein [Actomonas aquatica]|uniref:Chromosome partition protein Smc n=1 Tax=Actomonas aquatica TaxID=2866162 RepID=A0ABZ1CBR2_9BACT|nr:hypothetical protein [Opitutus sp. WL0086]WRQ88014.1 hypothetical protein K1X11_001245 [Opitutus sp. WL0086]